MRLNWTLALIAINVVVFLLEFLIPPDQFGFTPATAFQQPWTFITSMFLHADYTHIIFNMIALFIFGFYLESRIPKKIFLLAYFLAGIVGNLAYFATDPTSVIPAIGASGAIYGVIGTLAVLYPTLIVYIGLGLPMPMIVAAVIWVLTDIVGLFAPSGIAYQAHLGGIFVGIAVGIYLRLRRRRGYTFFFERRNDYRNA